MEKIEFLALKTFIQFYIFNTNKEHKDSVYHLKNFFQFIFFKKHSRTPTSQCFLHWAFLGRHAAPNSQ